MKRNEFEKFAKQGKTVISMDFVEGEEDLCTTGVVGDTALILQQIAKKLAFIFVQLTKAVKIDAIKNIDVLCNNIKVYYARIMAGEGNGKPKK